MTAPHTGPSEEQVRASIAWIKSMTLLHEDTEIRPAAMSYVKPSEYRRYAEAKLDELLALLDAGRKDRERVDALQRLAETDDLALWVRDNNWCVEVVDAEQKYRGASLRAAVDRARGA